jgi:hypothetical protein
MDRSNVASSSVSSIGYDPQTSTLEVEFTSGIYQYYGVPEYLYQQLMGAASKGQFLNTYIKNQYPYPRTG